MPNQNAHHSDPISGRQYRHRIPLEGGDDYRIAELKRIVRGIATAPAAALPRVRVICSVCSSVPRSRPAQGRYTPHPGGYVCPKGACWDAVTSPDGAQTAS